MLQNNIMIDRATGQPLPGTTVGTGNQLVSISNSGEISAHSVQEALRAIHLLQNLSAQGQITSVSSAASQMSQAEARQKRIEAVAAARNDPKKWAALASGLAERIQMFQERSSLMRRIVKHHGLSTGDDNTIPLENFIGEAIIATSSSDLDYQELRGKTFRVEEFEMKAHIRTSGLDLEQTGGDLLDEAYRQAQQSLVVAEDRLWKKAADATVGDVHAVTEIIGKLTPGYLSQIRGNLTDYDIPAQYAIIANDFWNDIHGSSDWATNLDPITKHDLAVEGQIATLQGMTIITDATRQPTQKVLDRGELYVVSKSDFHGIYTTRGGIRSRAVDGANSGDTSQGWLLWQYLSLTIGNAGSVAKAIRQ